jgi:hypothetical protein
VLCQANAAGVLDLKKMDADFVKGVADKAWAPLVSAAIKKCGPAAAGKYYYIISLIAYKFSLIQKKSGCC